MSKWVMACIGLGANVGNREETLYNALGALHSHNCLEVGAVSSVYETAPVGVLDQPHFLNAVAQIETALTARALLDFLLKVELDFGRKRIKKWGPRILDLDILLYGDAVIDEPGLTVPHPYLSVRGFVLYPLCDLIAEAKHPISNRCFKDLLDDVHDGAVHRVDNFSLWK